jgi:hypothetical protein
MACFATLTISFSHSFAAIHLRDLERHGVHSCQRNDKEKVRMLYLDTGRSECLEKSENDSGSRKRWIRESGGKGSHSNVSHPKVASVVTVSGKLGDDAKKYQERIVKYAIEESLK